MVLLPLLLYKLMPPEVTATPEAPAAARAALAALGPLSRHERIVVGDLRRHGGAVGDGGDAEARLDGGGASSASACCWPRACSR